ncbi:MAG: hypothetical protein R3E12_06300 [Candidatus Eisenbacteria bacterium]
MVGLETAFAVAYRELVQPGDLTLAQLVHRFSNAPRRVLGLPPTRVRVGETADLTVVRLDAPWRVKASAFATMGRSTPFEDWDLPVSVELTIAQGRITHQATAADRAGAPAGPQALAVPRG